MAKKTNPAPKKPAVKKNNDSLPDLKIYIDEQGRIVKNYPVDQLNDFLNEHVPDKKLEDS